MTEAKKITLPRLATGEVLDLLYQTYPDAHCELNFRNPFELLIATILAAQATDKKVNEITAGLFTRYPGPADFLTLTQEQLEQEIKQIGLYKNKAKNILATCRILLDQHGGEVPPDRAALEALPGVGRKTANVVLANAYGIPALAVDTHVQRVSNRIGLARSEDVMLTEQQLMKRIPKSKWNDAHHWLIFHGRRCCDARKPKCEQCPLTAHCHHYKANKKTRVTR